MARMRATLVALFLIFSTACGTSWACKKDGDNCTCVFGGEGNLDKCGIETTALKGDCRLFDVPYQHETRQSIEHQCICGPVAQSFPGGNRIEHCPPEEDPAPFAEHASYGSSGVPNMSH